MTLKQLRKTQRSYLASFDRGVIRRRKAIVNFFAHQIKERKKIPNPKNIRSIILRRKMMDMIHRSIYNNASRPSCARWYRTKKGTWYTTHSKRCEP